jgi:RNA polymerase sigma-70 factor, ECF subfamily
MAEMEPVQRYPLADAFLQSLPSDLDPEAAEVSRAALDRQLADAWTVARGEWPDFDVPSATFAAHVGRVAAGGNDPTTSLEDLAISDLYLACAALHVSGRALTAFEAHTFGEIHSAAAALRASDADVEEVKQVIRTQLFVSDGQRPPSVADYAGRGSLRGWVRVIATRELLRMKRKVRKEIPLEEYILHDQETHGDPELDRLKQAYREQVANALREAVGQLEIRERLLLRYQICDRLSIDEIGAIYQVHRATAARWLGKARSALLALTKERLAIVLSVDPGETDSILRLVQSQLDVSLESRLRDTPEGSASGSTDRGPPGRGSNPDQR